MKLTTERLKKLIREELSRMTEQESSNKEYIDGSGMSMSEIESEVSSTAAQNRNLALIYVKNVSEKTYEEYDEKANIDHYAPEMQDDGTYVFEFQV
jgi:hypothetical protein